MAEEYSAPGGLMSPHSIGTFTPVKVLEQVEKARPASTEDGSDQLVKLCSRLSLEDEITDRQFYQKWIKVTKYYEGEPVGQFASDGVSWNSYKPKIGDPYYIHPEFRYHSDAITTQWVQSRPDIRVLPANDKDETVGKARAANIILDYYEECLLTEAFLQREGKLGQFTGQMYRYTYWDPSKGRQVPRYDFQDETLQLSEGGYVACADCGFTGLPTDLAGGEMCPQCGSTNLVAGGSTPFTYPSPKEVGRYPIGDLVTESVSPFQVKVDRSQGEFKHASFLRRRRMLRPEVIKHYIPWWEPPKSGPGGIDHSIRAEAMLRQSVGQPGSSRYINRDESLKGTVIDQWWLVPCMYSDMTVGSSGLEFGGGEAIPPGTKFIDVYPEGMYLLIINNKLIDLRGEYLHDHWQHTPFILIPTRVEGDGIEDLCEPQRQLNDLNSLIYVDAKANSAPPTLVNTVYGVDAKDIAGKPHWTIPVRVPTGENIENAVHMLQGRAMPSQVFHFVDQLRGSMQLYAKSFSSATGAPDVAGVGGINTATGAQLMATNAQAMRSPELSLRADGNVTWATQVLKLFQKNATDEHYFPLQGRYGILEGNYFKGADVDADFVISIRRRSWMPRNEFDRRADLLGAMQAGLFDPSLPRAVRDALAEYFNIDINISTDIADIRIARMRLEQMKQLLEALGPQPGAEMLLDAAVPIEPISDNHPVCIEWWKDWLKTDEGLGAPPPLRAAAILKIQNHEMALANEMAKQAMLQFQAQAPVMAMTQGFQDQSTSEQQDQKAGHAIEKEKLRQFSKEKS